MNLLSSSKHLLNCFSSSIYGTEAESSHLTSSNVQMVSLIELNVVSSSSSWGWAAHDWLSHQNQVDSNCFHWWTNGQLPAPSHINLFEILRVIFHIEIFYLWFNKIKLPSISNFMTDLTWLDGWLDIWMAVGENMALFNTYSLIRVYFKLHRGLPIILWSWLGLSNFLLYWWLIGILLEVFSIYEVYI